jgi:hypothetical protein
MRRSRSATNIAFVVRVNAVQNIRA